MDNSTLTSSASEYSNSTSTTYSTSPNGADNSTSTLNDSTPFPGFYPYSPNLILPILVSILFLISALGHTIFMFRRKAYALLPFVLGVWTEAIGYAVRRLSASHNASRDDGLIYFLIQSLCIILSPSFMAASHYMIFGRLITYVGESYSSIRAKRVTLIFVIFDVLSIIIQGGGGILFSSENPDAISTAKSILLIGFMIQIAAFSLFGIFALIYQKRARNAGIKPGPWTNCLYTLYFGVLLILVRTIFRTLEFGTAVGNSSFLLDHEAAYYSLEALPILLCSFLFLFSHPSNYLPMDRLARLHSGIGANGTIDPNSIGMGMGTRNVNTYYDNQSRQHLQAQEEQDRYIPRQYQSQQHQDYSSNSYQQGEDYAASYKSGGSFRTYREDSREPWSRI